jgi:hypothetical protein
MGERGYMLAFVLVGAFLEGAIFTEACSFFCGKSEKPTFWFTKIPLFSHFLYAFVNR